MQDEIIITFLDRGIANSIFIITFTSNNKNMKFKLMLIVAIIAFAIAGTAQTNEKQVPISSRKIGVVVQLPMGVPTEAQIFGSYLLRHIDRSLTSLEQAPTGNFSVAVSYNIDKDGKVRDEFAETNPGYGAAEEVIRVMKKYSGHLPVLQDGNPVVFLGKLTVLFEVFDKHSTIGKSQPDTLDKFYSSEEVVVKIPASGSDWTHYLAKNLKSYVASENGAPSGRYTVMLSFVVDNDGTISDVKAENNPGYGTAEEAIRVMKNSPKWMPAQLNGRKIKYRAKNAITFVVSGD